MDKLYRVYDDRKPEETLFMGSHQEAMNFINENYIATIYLHIWMEEVK